MGHTCVHVKRHTCTHLTLSVGPERAFVCVHGSCSQAQQAQLAAARETEVAHNEALIQERDAGIRDIVRQVGAGLLILRCALYMPQSLCAVSSAAFSMQPEAHCCAMLVYILV